MQELNVSVKRGAVNNKPKFVQIAIDPGDPGHNGTLYALDQEGQVWFYVPSGQGSFWSPFSQRRKGE